MGFRNILLTVGLGCLLGLALPVGVLALLAREGAEGCFVFILGILVMIPFAMLLMLFML